MTPSPANPDLYARLGVKPTATEEEIRDAYRAGCKPGGAWAHPDACPGDPDASRRFREATEAYSVLSDADKRAEYDGRALNDAAVIGKFFHDLGAEMLDEVQKEAAGESFRIRGQRAVKRAKSHVGQMLVTPEGQGKLRGIVKAGWHLFLDLSRT